jgi:hypothetical protein
VSGDPGEGVDNAIRDMTQRVSRFHPDFRSANEHYEELGTSPSTRFPVISKQGPD